MPNPNLPLQYTNNPYCARLMLYRTYYFHHVNTDIAVNGTRTRGDLYRFSTCKNSMPNCISKSNSIVFINSNTHSQWDLVPRFGPICTIWALVPKSQYQVLLAECYNFNNFSEPNFRVPGYRGHYRWYPNLYLIFINVNNNPLIYIQYRS